MIKNNRTSVKFNKLLEQIFKLKVKLLNSSYELDINDIDERAKTLFQIYYNAKTLKQEVNIKVKNLAKQTNYLKYEHYIKNNELNKVNK
jgi:hypothetical protein|tara:strand:+ start:356 stop:622 length:267 start_codon:yes stop_codon:yes gene_type:complete